jgi:hypothetical protein
VTLSILRPCYISETATVPGRNIPRAACETPSEDNQVMLETCRDINS